MGGKEQVGVLVHQDDLGRGVGTGGGQLAGQFCRHVTAGETAAQDDEAFTACRCPEALPPGQMLGTPIRGRRRPSTAEQSGDDGEQGAGRARRGSQLRHGMIELELLG